MGVDPSAGPSLLSGHPARFFAHFRFMLHARRNAERGETAVCAAMQRNVIQNSKDTRITQMER